MLQVGSLPTVLIVYAPLAGQIGHFFKYGVMSVDAQASPVTLLFSMAN
jgi:hypothetical protein